MKYDTINGLDKQLSRLILGNDNQTKYDSAAKVWDHWIEVGGNTFDNAFIYGDGFHRENDKKFSLSGLNVMDTSRFDQGW